MTRGRTYCPQCESVANKWPCAVCGWSPLYFARDMAESLRMYAPDSGQLAPVLRDAADEIARLTRGLKEANKWFGEFERRYYLETDKVEDLSRELEGAREAFAVAMEYVHESHHAEIVATLEAKGIDLDALATRTTDTEG